MAITAAKTTKGVTRTRTRTKTILTRTELTKQNKINLDIKNNNMNSKQETKCNKSSKKNRAIGNTDLKMAKTTTITKEMEIKIRRITIESYQISNHK